MFKKILVWFKTISIKLKKIFITIFTYIGKFFYRAFTYARRHKKLSIIVLILLLLISLTVTFLIVSLRNDEEGIKTTEIPVNGVSILYEGTVIYLDEIGDEFKIDYEVLPSNAYNKKVKWTSSNDKLVSVSNNGVIRLERYKLENEEDPLITIETIDNGYKDSIYVVTPLNIDYGNKINEVLNNINVSIGGLEYKLLSNLQMVLSDKIEIDSLSDKLNVTDESIEYIWESSNKDIVNIDGNIATGEATITANTIGNAIITLKCIDSKGNILIQKEVNINVVLEDVINITYTGVKDLYYQGEIINNDNVILNIEYRNSKGQTQVKNVSYSKISTERLNTYTPGEVNKKIVYQGYEFSISFNVIEAKLTNFEVKGLKKYYTVYSNITATVEITLDDDVKFIYSLYELDSNIEELDFSIFGERELKIEYFNNIYSYKFNIIEKEVIQKSITGLKLEYPLNSIIKFDEINVLIEYNTSFNNEEASYLDIDATLNELLSESELKKLFDNSTIGHKKFVIYVGPYKEEFTIEYNVIDSIVNVEGLNFIIPIKNEYLLNEEVVLNVEAIYDGYELDTNVTDNLILYLNGSKVGISEITRKAGSYRLIIYYGSYSKEFIIDVLNKYTINYYNENDELISSNSGNIKTFTLQSIPLKTFTGYEFDYYKTNNEGLYVVMDTKLEMTTYDTETEVIIDLYYKRSSYTITYNIIGKPLYVETYKYQDIIVEYVPEELKGYIFSGWNKQIPEYMPANDIVVKGTYVDENSAYYVVKYYLEDLNQNYVLEDFDNSVIASGQLGEFIIDDSNGLNIKLVDENNIYLDISKEYTGFTYKNYEIVDNVCNIYFERNSYSINYKYDGYTYIDSYKYLEEVDVYIPIKYGYTFDGWDKEIPNIMLDEDINVTGSFTPNTYKLTIYYNDYVRNYLFKCDEEFTNLPVLNHEVNEFLGWKDSEGTIYTKMPSHDITLYPAWKEYVKIVSYSIEGLKSNYLLNDVINKDNIYINFVLEDETEYRVKLIDILVSGDFNTNIIGIKELNVKYQNQTVSLYYEVSESVKEIVKVEITNFPEYFYYLDNITLESYYLKIYYTDSYVELPLTSNKLHISGFDLNSVGNKTLIISYLSEIITIPYDVVNPINISIDEVLILEDTYSFYINIDESVVPTGYVLNISNSDKYIYSYLNKGNGIYYVTVTLQNSNNASIIIGINGLPCYETVSLTKINLDEIDLVIEGKDYGFINRSFPLTLSIYYNNIKYSMSGVKYEWFTENSLDLTASNNYCSVIGDKKGKVIVYVKVMIGDAEKTIDKEIEIIDPYEGIRFIDNKIYGIGEILTLGGFKYNSNNQLVSKTYLFDIVGKTSVDISDLVWYTSDNDIATFGRNGELNIHGDGYVTLFVTSKDAFNYSLTSSNYTGSLNVRCVYDAVYATSYFDIVKAFDSKKQVVLGNNIEIGNQVMTLKKDSTGNTIREKITGVNVNKLVNDSVRQIVSTWDTDYLKNIYGENFNAYLNYCLEITNNLYGNGYTLDCYQITTASSIDSSVKVFNGPLDFVALLNAAAVKGQDNIGFLVRDNVIIDNVILQNCDDGYLYSNGLFDYSKLEKIGTTVEVMGDNVSIINSRIRNGRNVVRIFGSEDKEQVINVRIESSIIANAREFLIKIGANKSIDENCYIDYNGEKTYITDLYSKYNMSTSEVSKYIRKNELTNDIYKTCKPELLDSEGNPYQRIPNNQKDEYFVNNYLKTKVTIKNIVLTNTNFYAIGMESKFAGPILGGYRFAPKDIEVGLYEGCYNISGTSYAALLTLEEDVRIYNWKKLNEIDSTSLIERLEDADKIETFGIKIEINIKDFISSVTSLEGFEKIVDNINGEQYSHGGIVFYGGGYNYHMINLDNYTGHALSKYSISFNALEDNILSGVLPWAAGNSAFSFYMYDSDSKFNYQYQQAEIESGSAYNWIEPVR